MRMPHLRPPSAPAKTVSHAQPCLATDTTDGPALALARLLAVPPEPR